MPNWPTIASIVISLFALAGTIFTAVWNRRTSNEVERLKRESTEHQVRFSKLHERQAAVVEELHRRFVEAFWATKTYHSWAELNGGPAEEDQLKTAMEKLTCAFQYFEVNRIYLSTGLADKLEYFLETAGMHTRKVGYFSSIPNKTDGTDKLHTDARMAGLDAFRGELVQAKHAIQAEFKTFLDGPPRFVRPQSRFRPGEKANALR
jgi:hypothetical protein